MLNSYFSSIEKAFEKPKKLFLRTGFHFLFIYYYYFFPPYVKDGKITNPRFEN